jgi:hypothetical protein
VPLGPLFPIVDEVRERNGIYLLVPIVDEVRERNGIYLLACAQLTEKQIFQIVKI